mmetsp:Transcript_21414/g.59438  ORF Transcript_21414/g.59438 Transcript_21414/m.59438 type:complete len:327 (-) Transcript_21414:100-1080(-)
MQLVFRETAAENHQRARLARHNVGRGIGLPDGRVLRPRGLPDLHLRVASPLGVPDLLRGQEGELLLPAQHLQVDAHPRHVCRVALSQARLEKRRLAGHRQAVDAHDQVLPPIAHDARQRALQRAVLGHHQLRAERGGHAGAPQHRHVGGAGRAPCGQEATALQAARRARHGQCLPGEVRRELGRAGLRCARPLRAVPADLLALGPLGPGVLAGGGRGARGLARRHWRGQRAAQHHVRQEEDEHHRHAQHPLPQSRLAQQAPALALPGPGLLAVVLRPVQEPKRAAPVPRSRGRRRGVRHRVVGQRQQHGCLAAWRDDQPASRYEQG